MHPVPGYQSGSLNASVAAARHGLTGRLRTPPPWRWIGGAVGVAGLLIATGIAFSAVKGFSIGFLLRDPNAIAEQPFYYGMLEYSGAILMAAAAGIALFSASLLTALRPGTPGTLFLAMGGLLSFLLVSDDLFQLHESLWRIGLSELQVFTVYGTLALALLACNMRIIRRTSVSLWLMSGLFFVTAIAMDAAEQEIAGFVPVGTEDCLELFGILFWSAYLVKSSRDIVLGFRSDKIADHGNHWIR